MRDQTHADHVERWAEFVRTNPQWKKFHTDFINGQFEKAESFMHRLVKEKDGEEIVADIYKIKNRKGYPSLFSKQ